MGYDEMSEEKEPNQIEEIIKALDYNLKNLEDARGMTMADVKTFILDILGTVRDMWELFQPFFEEMEKLAKIKETTSKGKTYEKGIIKDPEIKRLYL